jgi:hypothetical protein
MSPQLFVATLLGLRMGDNAIEAQTNTLLIFRETEQEAHQEAERAIEKRFPSADGWVDQQISLVPIPPEVEDDGYKLTWQIEKLAE